MNIKTIIKKNRTICFIAYYFMNIRDKHGYIQKGNKIINEGIKISTKIKIRGKNNIIKIGKHTLIKNSSIVIIGNNSYLQISDDAFISGATLWIEDDFCRLEIGKKTFIGPSHLAVTENGSKLLIGEDCMLSSNINIRTGDSHSIIDLETSHRINNAKNICISNHVWIGEGAKILKGVNLGDNCIISTGSIVTKSFPSNCLIGGIPAKILKEKVTWTEKRI